MTETRTEGSAQHRAKVIIQARKRNVRRFRISIVLVLLLVFGYDSFFGTSVKKAKRTRHAMVVRVQDANGQSMQNVLVQFYRKGSEQLSASHEARTNAEGLVQLPSEISDGSYLCVGRGSDGTISMTEIHEIEKGPGVLVLAAPGKIEGKVTSNVGADLENAIVEARFIYPFAPVLETTRTDRSGRFIFTAISKDLPALQLRAMAEGYAHKDLEYNARSDVAALIELEPSRPLLLEILAPDGSPASGVAIAIKRRPDLTTKSDASGYCRIAGLSPSSPVLLRIVHEYLTYRISHTLLPGAARLRLRLEEPIALIGRVVDAQGIGIQDVELRHEYGPSGWPNGWIRTKSGKQGKFRLQGLPSGDLQFVYELPSGASGTANVKLVSGTALKDYVLQVSKD